VLPPSAARCVVSVVGAVLAGGSSVSVGCCVGADALVAFVALRAAGVPVPVPGGAVQAARGAPVLAAVPAVPGALGRLSVFAAFGPGGAGACSLSAVGVVAAAAQAGASVRWWAGGGAAVPLRGRLAARSAACVRSAQALVLFSPGAGSLAAALPAALAAGLPVFVFAPSAPSCVGGWVAGSFAGQACWARAGAGQQLALF